MNFVRYTVQDALKKWVSTCPVMAQIWLSADSMTDRMQEVIKYTHTILYLWFMRKIRNFLTVELHSKDNADGKTDGSYDYWYKTDKYPFVHFLSCHDSRGGHKNTVYTFVHHLLLCSWSESPHTLHLEQLGFMHKWNQLFSNWTGLNFFLSAFYNDDILHVGFALKIEKIIFRFLINVFTC